MKVITYSLKDSRPNSDRFLADLQKFTWLVQERAQEYLGEIANEFSQWIDVTDSEPRRTTSEYLFDLLVMGVLWHVYGAQSTKASGKIEKLLTRLVEIRKTRPFLKPGADLFRGLLGGISIHRDGNTAPIPPLDLERLKGLIHWLASSGDFKEEVRRLTLWEHFFAGLDNPSANFHAVGKFSEWFDQASLETLGQYTSNVETFLDKEHRAYRWREDYIFTGRQRVEYHLNMVGTEIMNQVFREKFLQSGQKIIFVPPCMASPDDGKCKAKDTPYGARCEHCTPGCQVNQITRYGEKHNIQVFMIPDSFSPLSWGNKEGFAAKSLGVVGVSCPLTIVSGGLEMRRIGIPAQGLLLDHCGCSWHWDPGKGIVTEINFGKLIEIFED